MYCLHLTQISTQQKNDLQQLVATCQKKESFSLSIPEDASHYLLICRSDTHTPLSCLIICEALKNRWECYAYTHPACRRKGLFTRLLGQACRMARQQEGRLKTKIHLLLLSDQKSPDGLAAAKALHLRYQYSEYQMSQKCGKSGPSSLLLRRKITPAENGIFFAYPNHHKDELPVGTCRVIPYGQNRFYLYHVAIRPDMRGKGWGTQLIYALFNWLPAEHTVTLQVSSQNQPALHLYKKTGFQIIETLSFYAVSRKTRLL